jgi:hypothetical protein
VKIGEIHETLRNKSKGVEEYMNRDLTSVFVSILTIKLWSDSIRVVRGKTGNFLEFLAFV